MYMWLAINCEVGGNKYWHRISVRKIVARVEQGDMVGFSAGVSKAIAEIKFRWMSRDTAIRCRFLVCSFIKVLS